MRACKILTLAALAVLAACTVCSADDGSISDIKHVKQRMKAMYGENQPITDDNYNKSLAVKCINGTFVGRKSGNVIAYKGIPFVGKQPVGNLRWKAPVEFAPDDGIYEAYYNAKSPVQDEDITEPASLYVQGEDCLYLNIWKADDNNKNEKKPVMVWIHGGAYEVGGTADPMYECRSLVAENPDIIAVTIAYRLGVFGFLHLSHLPDGAEYPDAQNLGLMDQVMALKWVHENIANFGGDPDNVTIFGESAGAGSVTLIPLIDGTHRYFKRVIAQSGSPTTCRSAEQSVAATDEVLAALNCKSVADLRNVPVDKLVATAADLLDMRTAPERDGKYLPLDTYAAYANGALKDIAILHGCNKDEMNYFVLAFYGMEPFMEWAVKQVDKKLSELTPDERKLAESYFNEIKNNIKEEKHTPYCSLLSQIWFNAPMIRLSEVHSKAGGKSYTYYFTPESTLPYIKCGHALELASVFKHPENTIYTGRAFDETFSKNLRRMWVQFAKTGDPSLSAEDSPDGRAHVWPLYIAVS